MPTIFCTKKLEKFIGPKLMESEESMPLLGRWSGNYFVIDRKKYLLLTHQATCYSLVFPQIVKKDILNIRDLFIDRLFSQMIYDNISYPPTLFQRLQTEPFLGFFPTDNNKKVLATMNSHVQILNVKIRDDFEMNTILEINGFITGYYITTFGGFKKPTDLFQEYINNIVSKHSLT